jgi:hypothetical protein
MRGACPTHGISLCQTGVVRDDSGIPIGDMVGCPRKDCDFETEAFPGSKFWKAIHGE